RRSGRRTGKACRCTRGRWISRGSCARPISPVPDRWATWLAERRFGGSDDARLESQALFEGFRRRVLDGARIEPGDAVLDVGCGGYDVREIWDVARKLRGCFGAETLVGWDERDLLRWIEEAGFTDVEVTVELEVKPHPMTPNRDWDTFRNFAPNPLAPTLQEAMDEALTPEEQQRFVAHFRPLVERGEGGYRMASAYVRAVKS